MRDLMSTNGIRVYSTEEMKKFAPAIFSDSYSPNRTRKYTFLPTEQIIDQMTKMGWEPYSVRQQGRSQYARHLIRMENPSIKPYSVDGDTIKPQLLIDNSHNGLSSARIHVGLFRLVCSNGLVVGIPNMHSTFKFRHMGMDKDNVFHTVEEATKQFEIIINHVEEMKSVEISKELQEELAIRAIAMRHSDLFMDDDKNILRNDVISSVDISDIISPKRTADAASDLWTVFNKVQEKTINGEYTIISNDNKERKARPITSIERNLTFNRELWQMAEELV